MKILAIAGVMGSGKSTFSKRFKAKVLPEPFEQNPYIFTQEHTKCQLIMFDLVTSQYKQAKSLSENENVIIDTPIEMTLFVFSKMLVDEGKIPTSVYDKLLAKYYDDYKLFDIPIIALEVTLSTMLERIRKRGRPYEQDTAAFHEKLYNYYQHWLASSSKALVIDNN